jgi:hypothetical protein
MSMSISRGPFRGPGVRPMRRSISCVARRSSRGVPFHSSAATALKKSGCAAKPTGSVR